MRPLHSYREKTQNRGFSEKIITQILSSRKVLSSAVKVSEGKLPLQSRRPKTSHSSTYAIPCPNDVIISPPEKETWSRTTWATISTSSAQSVPPRVFGDELCEASDYSLTVPRTQAITEPDLDGMEWNWQEPMDQSYPYRTGQTGTRRLRLAAALFLLHTAFKSF